MSDVLQKKVVILFITPETEEGSQTKQERYQKLSSRAREMGFIVAGVFAVPLSQCNLGFSHAVASCLAHGAKILFLESAHSLALGFEELAQALRVLVHNHITLMVGDTSVVTSDYLKIFLDVLEANAQAERNNRSGRIKNSLLQLAKKGVVLGGRKYGSTPEEARIIRQILKLNNEGKSLEEICQLLDKNNIKTARNKKWYPTTVKRLIERNKTLNLPNHKI